MTVTTGRREANKRATRQALQQAADRLFAEQGYAETTVRDIAAAAGVTERTFFRYFGGKEELIIDDALAWLPLLKDHVRARPAGEDPVTALRHAVRSLGADLRQSPRPSPLWLFNDGPPGVRINRLSPGAVLRAESGMDTRYLAGILARTTFALIRSALIRGWELRSQAAAPAPDEGLLTDQAFSTMRLPSAAGPDPG